MDQTNMEDRVRKLELELTSHEAQNEERWKTNFTRLVEIEHQLSQIQKTIMAGGATTIFFLAGIVFSLLI